MLDDRAIADYKSRLEAIETELLKAEKNDDMGTTELLRSERKFIQDQLLAARGLHGRKRSLQDPLKVNRDRVRSAINRALDRVREQHSDLADHLEASLFRGTAWSYRPRPPVEWIV